jgi:hypothetical protein
MIFKSLYISLITTPSWQRWALLVVVLISGYLIWQNFWYAPYARARVERDSLMQEIADYQARYTVAPKNYLPESAAHEPGWYRAHILACAQDTQTTLERLVITPDSGTLRIDIRVCGDYLAMSNFIACIEESGLLWLSAIVEEKTVSGTLTLAPTA